MAFAKTDFQPIFAARIMSRRIVPTFRCIKNTTRLINILVFRRPKFIYMIRSARHVFDENLQAIQEKFKADKTIDGLNLDVCCHLNRAVQLKR